MNTNFNTIFTAHSDLHVPLISSNTKNAIQSKFNGSTEQQTKEHTRHNSQSFLFSYNTISI